MLVVALRPFPDLPPRHAKLRTAGDPNDLGHFRPRKQLHESCLEVLPRMKILAVRVGEGMDFIRATQDPGAAQIDVSFFLNIGGLNFADHGNAIVVRVIVVPLVALGVDEEHDIGQVVVVVNDVAGKAMSSVALL